MTPPASLPFRRTLWRWAAWLGCTLAVGGYNFQPTRAALEEDELYWIGSAYYFHLAWERGDWRHSDWRLLPARENPPLAKYVIGAVLAARGQTIATPDMLGTFYLLFEGIPGAWGTGVDRAKRVAVADRVQPAVRAQLRPGMRLTVPDTILHPARGVMLACAVVASGLVFLLGTRLGHWTVGLLASQLLLLHPAVVAAYNHAMADAVALLFSVAAATAIAQAAARVEAAGVATGAAAFRWAAGIGLLLALACAAKMNSLIVVGLLAALALLEITRRLRARQRAAAGWVLLATAGALSGALLCFIALNPAMLPDLRGGLADCVREHRITEAIQARFLAGHLTGWGEKLAAVAQQSGLGWTGFALLAAGAIGVGCAAGATGRVVGVWALLAAVAITAWIPFERSRYVLPLVPPAVLGLGWLAAEALPRWVRRLGGRGPRHSA